MFEARVINLLEQILEKENQIMGDLTQLTADVNKLQSDVTALNTLVTGTVIPDITKAITLIGQGNDQAAIDALDAIVQQSDATVGTLQSGIQAADTSLEGAEGGPSSPATKS